MGSRVVDVVVVVVVVVIEREREHIPSQGPVQHRSSGDAPILFSSESSSSVCR